MRRSTLYMLMSLLMSVIGITILWGQWTLIAGIFFLLFGNNLMRTGHREEDKEYTTGYLARRYRKE